MTAAIRSLRRRGALAAAVIVTLMLAVGANSAIFSAIDAVLLRPLPFPDADRLVTVYESSLEHRESTSLVAPGRIEEWNAENQTFVALAGSYFENTTETSGPLPERVEGRRVSPRFFAVLGVAPAIGRWPDAVEETFGGPAVVVLSDAYWRRRLNADPSIVGRALTIGGARRTVIAVMPPSFRYPTASIDVWMPVQAPPSLLQARQARFYTAIGRLKPDVSVVRAVEDLTAVQARLGVRYPATDAGWAASVAPMKEEQVGGVRRSLWLLLGAVTLVLLAACGNIACLMLADAARRQQDVAVRFALGATRFDVVRQLLTEGGVLALAGAALGLLLSWWGLALMRASANLPRAQEIRLDARLVVFTLVVGVGTTLLFALVPAWRATRAQPSSTLARGGRGSTGAHQPIQRLLVAAQVSLAVVLLVAAGLPARSFARLQQVSPGFDATGVLTFRMSAQWSERTEAVVNRLTRTQATLSAVPGVDAVATSQLLPAHGVDLPPGEFEIRGRDSREKLFAVQRGVSAGYFRALRIPLLAGETCRDNSVSSTTLQTLVTRSFADRFFTGSDPIGHEVRPPGLPLGVYATIVGIVGEVRENGLAIAPAPTIYWCGINGYWPDPFFLVRLSPQHAASVASIRAAMRELEPNRAVYDVEWLNDSLSASLSQPRLNTILLALFAVMTLGLAAMGLYGVLAQIVSARRREIGVRVAIGARPADVIRTILAPAAAMTATGALVGLAGAFAVSRVMTSLLFGTDARDPLTFALVPTVLVAVAALAAWIPARRAARIDPVDALRD